MRDNRFYLQALGAAMLFVVVLLLLWIRSGGPASEAQVRNAVSTRTAIAMTEVFLLRPGPTNTPLFILPTSVDQTLAPGPTSTYLPTPAPILPQTGTSTPSIITSVTPLSTQTAVVPVPASATAFSHLQPTKAPPLILQTGNDLQDPSGFIHWYFGRVWKERDYQNLWDNYLTPSFKAHVGSGLFEDYAGWWNSVEQVDVNSVDVIENNGTNARVRVNVTIRMKDGHILPNQIFDYELLYDPQRRTWMFDYGS